MARGSNVTTTNEVVEGEVVTKSLMTMTPLEYEEYSNENGRIMGRKEGQKTRLYPEQLRVLINEGYTPEKVKEKFGINDAELEQIVFQLSKDELRPTPIKFGKKVVG